MTRKPAFPFSPSIALLVLTASSALCFDGALALPSAKVGQPFSYTIAIDGGISPYVFVLSSGTLPPGLSLSSAGVISGTPASTQRVPFSFGIQIKDDSTPPQLINGTFILPVEATPMRIVPAALMRVRPFTPGPIETAAVIAPIAPDRSASPSAALTFGPQPGKVSVIAQAEGAGSVQFRLSSAPPMPPTGTLTRTLVGLEQAGASSAPSTAKFFFDFYITRPIGPPATAPGLFGSPFRWRGSVRLGTTPIQTTAALSSLASGLTQTAKSLTLNQLAQAGEFLTGFEYQLPGLRAGPLTPLDHGREFSTLGFFADLGATLPFSPRSAVNVYDLPAQINQQGFVDQGRSRFNSQFPQFASTTATQVAFATPDRNQFFRQYSAGVRLTTLYQDQDETSSAFRSLGSVSFSIGQNEAVTGGKLRGLVAQAEGFFPLPIALSDKSLSAFYLFGRAAFQLNASAQVPPLLLNSTTPQPTIFSQSLVIATPSRRDLYTFGLGVDAVRFLKTILASKTASAH